MNQARNVLQFTIWYQITEKGKVMEDRYLFKAKKKNWQELPKDEQWVQGYYYQIWENGYILWGMTNDVPNMIEVDVSTLCQCTSLKDKNGDLIWENDIINTQCGKAVVIWDKAEWRIKWIDDLIWRKDLHYWANDNNWRIEVIGNIFDNPELLESEG